MVLFGIEFSAAEAVLLGIGVLLVLLMIALLRRSSSRVEQAESAPVPAAASTVPAAAPQQAEEEELIAVITAAAAAAMGKEAKQVRVTSYREVAKRQYAGRSAWSRAGRAQQVNRYI